MRTLVRLFIVLTIGATGLVAATGCDEGGTSGGEEHAVVESGTYTGTVEEVKPSEKEIYVDSDGRELELYFIEETKLTRKGETVSFSALEKGQKIEVKVKKVGKRLDPLSVEILE